MILLICDQIFVIFFLCVPLYRVTLGMNYHLRHFKFPFCRFFFFYGLPCSICFYFFLNRKTEYSKPGFQFRQIYLQQVGKKKKSKKSKQKKKKASTTTTTNSSMFSSDSENEDKHVSKAVKNVLNSMCSLPWILKLKYLPKCLVTITELL